MAAQASAEKGADVEASLRKLPAFLRELRTTMASLEYFSKAGTPVSESLAKAAPALTQATRALTPFSAASTVSLKSLGAAGETAGPKIRAADPMVKKTRDLARSGATPATELAEFLVSTREHKGFDGLADLIYNSAGATNEFDQYGHFTRTLTALTNCTDYVTAPTSAARPTSTGPAPARPPRSPTRSRLYRRLQETLGAKSGGTSSEAARLDRAFPGRAEPGEARPDARSPGLGESEELGAKAEATPPPNAPSSTTSWGHEEPRRNTGSGEQPGDRRRGHRAGHIVAVFLAYNANNGLPFVSTYDLKARVPNADALVKGNEVRIGGSRVGVVKEVTPVQLRNGRVAAELSLSLDKSAEPIPANSTMIIRPKSPLGLKYLQIVPGDSLAGLQAGETIPLSAARPEPVDIDQFFDMFDAKTRTAIQRSHAGFGNAFAGRGPQFNAALGSCAGTGRTQPAGAAHARRAGHPLRPLLAGAGEPLGHRRAGRGAAGEHVRRPRPHLRRLRPRLAPLHPGNDRQGPADARRGDRRPARPAALLPRLGTLLHRPQARREGAGRNLADDQRGAAGRHPGAQPLAAPLRAADADGGSAARLPERARCLQRARPLDRHQRSARAGDQVHRAGADHLQLPEHRRDQPRRRVQRIERQGQLAGAIAFEPPDGPNAESQPASAPANGPGSKNHLHFNPYPRTGQGGVCEAGNERYAAGQTMIGHAPQLWGDEDQER